jgi:hypothetical protein
MVSDLSPGVQSSTISLRLRSDGSNLKSCVKNLPALGNPSDLERNHRNCHIHPL